MKKGCVRTCMRFGLMGVMISWDMVPHTKSELKRVYMHSVIPHPTARHVVQQCFQTMHRELWMWTRCLLRKQTFCIDTMLTTKWSLIPSLNDQWTIPYSIHISLIMDTTRKNYWIEWYLNVLDCDEPSSVDYHFYVMANEFCIEIPHKRTKISKDYKRGTYMWELAQIIRKTYGIKLV